MKSDKTEVKNLFENLKSSVSAAIDTPIQKVIPVTKSPVEDIARFTFHLPKARFKSLKLKAAQEGITIKDLINNALVEQYGL